MKKFILWDNDGVLVDTEKYYFQANKIVLGELGLELTDETYKEISLKQGKSVLELAREIGFDDKMILTLRNKRDEVYEQFIFNENLALDGAEETLESLSGKLRMGVVTSNKREYFRRLHAKTGFLKYFEFVVAREDYQITKPDPEAYQIGIQKSGFSENEIVAVEDTPRGLAAANNAGIDCIVIPNEFTLNAEFNNSRLKLNSIIDLTLELIHSL